MNIVFRRWLSARRLTPPCGGKRAQFSFRMKPTTLDSVLRLQTLEIEVNPNEVVRRQGLFTTGHAYFRLGIETAPCGFVRCLGALRQTHQTGKTHAI